MKFEKSPAELLESIHNIIAKDLTGKTAPRKEAVSDPVLWQAIQSQQKNEIRASFGYCGFPGKWPPV